MVLVLFENLTPICMLVIEVFQSSIASSPMRFQKIWVGLFLQGELLDSDSDCDRSISRLQYCSWKTTPYTRVEEEPEVCHMYGVLFVSKLSYGGHARELSVI